MRRIFFVIPAFLLAFVVSCTTADYEKNRQKLLETDKEFSTFSQQEGMKKAFLKYCAPEAVLLRPNSQPISGKESIEKHLGNRQDDASRLSWEPQFADVAHSGEMGYTYGTYKAEYKNADGHTEITQGTYISVWKKDPEGDWKYVLDTGNEGLGGNE